MGASFNHTCTKSTHKLIAPLSGMPPSQGPGRLGPARFQIRPETVELPCRIAIFFCLRTHSFPKLGSDLRVRDGRSVRAKKSIQNKAKGHRRRYDFSWSFDF